MIGNNVVVLADILTNPDDPLKRSVKGKDKEYTNEEIHRLIQQEYWKHWKHLLMYSEKANIECSGLGYFMLSMNHAKKRCRMLINKIRRLRENCSDKINIEGTRACEIHQNYLKEFRILWQQLNVIRRRHIEKMNRINKTLKKKGLEHKIRIKYEDF